MSKSPTDRVTRFEVIDERGRRVAYTGVRVELSYQDRGRTLKAFVTSRKSAHEVSAMISLQPFVLGRKTFAKIAAVEKATARKEKRQ